MTPCGHDDESTCQECCEHFEHDHGICLDCEKDITDRLVAQAEDAADRAKDREMEGK